MKTTRPMKTDSNRRKKPGTGRSLAQLQEIPNVGPAIAKDLLQLGINAPADLHGRDHYAMYDDLCRITGVRHDPWGGGGSALQQDSRLQSGERRLMYGIPMTT